MMIIIIEAKARAMVWVANILVVINSWFATNKQQVLHNM